MEFDFEGDFQDFNNNAPAGNGGSANDGEYLQQDGDGMGDHAQGNFMEEDQQVEEPGAAGHGDQEQAGQGFEFEFEQEQETAGPVTATAQQHPVIKEEQGQQDQEQQQEQPQFELEQQEQGQQGDPLEASMQGVHDDGQAAVGIEQEEQHETKRHRSSSGDMQSHEQQDPQQEDGHPAKKVKNPEGMLAALQEATNSQGKVYLANLHWWTTDLEVESLCTQYGQVASIEFMTERSNGKSKGVVLVEFITPEAAVACKQALQGYMLQGRPVATTFATQGPGAKPGPPFSVQTVEGMSRQGPRHHGNQRNAGNDNWGRQGKNQRPGTGQIMGNNNTNRMGGNVMGNIMGPAAAAAGVMPPIMGGGGMGGMMPNMMMPGMMMMPNMMMPGMMGPGLQTGMQS